MTKMRPLTRTTSMSEPYRRDSTGPVITSSTVPSAAWPLPRYSTRSSAPSSGLISCALNSTAMPSSCCSVRVSSTTRLLVMRVEADQRLVQQQQARPAQQGLGQQQALPLAARGFGQRAAGKVGGADPLERPGDLARAPRASSSGRPQRWPAAPLATKSQPVRRT